MMGTMWQRTLSAGAEKQKLFFPYLLEPCLRFSGACQTDSPGSNTELGSSKLSTGSLTCKCSWSPNNPKATDERSSEHQTKDSPFHRLSIATGFNEQETFSRPFLRLSAVPTAEPDVPVVRAKRLLATLRPGWKNGTSTVSLVSPSSALGADPLLSEGAHLLHMNIPDAPARGGMDYP